MELCNILGPRTAQLTLRCGKLRSYNKTRFVTNLQTLNPDAVSSLVVRGQLSVSAGKQTPPTKQWLSADNHDEGVGKNPPPQRIHPQTKPSSAPLLAYAQATEQAWILGGRMAQRTERLLSVTDARVKGAAEMDQRLLDDDS